MAITRINNNQITDAAPGNVYVGVNAAAKVQSYSITSAKLANNITYDSSLVITGNLTVQGNTTSIDTVNLVVEDPLIILASEQTGVPAVDIGFIGQRGTEDNIAWFWDESADEFAAVFTTSLVTNTVVNINSYASVHMLDLTARDANITGNITFSGNIVGNVTVTGNVNADNLNATTNVTGTTITASGNLEGNNAVITSDVGAATVTATGNVSGGNITTVGAVVATGNVSGGNITTAGVVDATGNVSGGNLTTAGAVVATGNVSGGNVEAINAVNAGTTITATGNVSGGNITTAGNVDGANVNATGTVTATGNVSGGNITTAGAVEATGNVSGGNLTTAGAVVATGNVSGGNITTAGNVDGANINATANVTGTGAVFTGNVTAANFIGNISGNIDAGGANTNIQFNDDDVLAGSAAFTFDKTSNLVTASGNISAGNLSTGGVVTATGNVSGGNITTAGVVEATGNVIGGNLTTVGNVDGSNVNATGTVTATANVSGGNLTTAGVVVATGNVSGGNITTAGAVVATGNVSGGNITTSGNVDGGNVNASGVVIATGNVSGGNITTAGAVDATGNVIGGNITTVGVVDATGNVSGGNITTIGNIDGGNVNAANGITAGTTIVATGNVTGGNITTAGNVDANNVNATADVTAVNVIASGNVDGGNINSNSIVGGDIVITATSVDMNLTGNLIMGGSYINQLAAPIQPQDAATKRYVDDAVSAGLHIHTPVQLETPTALPSATYAQGGNVLTVTDTVASNVVVFSTAANLQVNDQLWFTSSFEGIVANISYFVVSTPNTSAAVLSTLYNGTPVANITSNTGLSQSVRVNSGIGATLTAVANGALTVDSVTAGLGNRILVYNQITQYENGVYTVTDTGNVTAPWILTRATDSDQYAPDTNDGMDSGSYYFVQGGASGAGESYVMTSPAAEYIIGFDAVEFTQFSASQVYSANTQAGIDLTGTVFSAKVDNDTTAFDVGGNIKVKDGANLVTPNIGNATGNSLTLSGNGLLSATTVEASGNVLGGNVNSNAAVTGVTITASGNIDGANVNASAGMTAGSTITATGNISGGNLSTAGQVTATGNITGGNVNTIGAVVATGNVTGGNITTVGNVDGANLNATGTVTATGNVSGGNLTTAGAVVATGNVSGGNITTAGAIDATGNITGGNISAGNGLITTTGNIECGNIIVSNNVGSGTIITSGNIDGGNINATANITGTGAVFSGNVTAANFIGNVSGNIDAGGANTNIQFNDGDVLAGSAAFTFDKTSNAVTASGNISAGNLSTGGVVTATGNVSGGNITTGGEVVATGNVSGGNLTTAGAVVATGNVSGGNISAGSGTIVTTGNIDGGNINATANVTGQGAVFSGNVTAANFIGNVFGNIGAAGANTNIQFNDGDVLAGSAAFTFDKTSNVVTATGNISAGNLSTGGEVTATGNVSGGNLNTAGTVVATGNVDGGNINATSEITAGTTVTATGNVSGGNITTGGVVTAIGNITGGNLITTGTADLGNIRITGNDITNFASSIITINAAASDIDVRISGDTVANLLVTDAGTDTVLIGGGNATIGAALKVDTTDSMMPPVGNLAQRPGTPVVGMFRYSTTEDALEVYTAGDGWIPVGAPIFTVIEADEFIGNGACTEFTLSANSTTAATIVAINGVVQIPTTAYSVSGNVLTFTEAPEISDVIDARTLTTTTTVIALENISGNAKVETLNTADTVQITGNLLPSANITFDLGSTTLRWRDGYFAGNSITLGNTVLKNTTGNTIGFFGPDGVTPAPIDAASVDTSQIANGTSSVAVVSSGGNIRANVAGATVALITTDGLEITGNLSVTGNASLSGNILGDRVQNGNTSIDIQTPNGNANITVGGISNVAVFTSTGANITGTLNATGNANVGNLGTAGLITSTGNITGGNLITAGLVSLASITKTGSNGTGNIGSATSTFDTIFAKATSAQYADLAEMYEADAEYEPGTVLCFGGSREVTLCAQADSTRVAGVVSTNPSYLMNSGQSGEYVAAVALTGRVPCRVTGTIRKGDLIVSAGDGRGRANNLAQVGTVIGKALADFDGADGVIEVVVGRV
jgi:filamentous hemagglutinin